MIKEVIQKRVLADELLYGRLAPQSVELEEAILGACMLEKEACGMAIEILNPIDFYKEAHKTIFDAIRILYKANQSIDILTVSEKLRGLGKLEEIGGAFSVAELTNRVGSTANIEYHCLIIRQKSKARSLINICSQTISKLYDDSNDSEVVLQKHSGEVIELETEHYNTKNIDASARMEETIRVVQKAMQQKGLSGVRTGSAELDRMTGGWQKGNLITIGGRPGMFKTGLAIHLAHSAGEPVAFFELEMSNAEVGMREIAMKTGLRYSRLRNGHLGQDDFNKIIKSAPEIERSSVYVDTFSDLNLIRFQSKVKKMIALYGVKMAIIDYLQLADMDEDDGNYKTINENQQISRFTKGLKNFAKQVQIPIIILAQLNRSVETTSDKKPKLHHLRDSGSIEQNSDVVLFVFRPEYYEPGKLDADGVSLENYLELIIAKQKQGATGSINLFADVKTNFITDWENRNDIPYERKNELLLDKDTPF